MHEQILLVDDNPIQAVTRKAILERVGLSVQTFTSARDALLFLQADVQKLIGLVMVDHIMPELSGTAFVRQLREWNTQMPVIVLSGLDEAEAEYQDYNVIFRTKPIAPDELQALAVHLLNASAPRTTA